MNKVVLFRASLEGANLSGADLAGATLISAELNTSTILPDLTQWTPETDMARFTNPTHPMFWRSNDQKGPAYSTTTIPITP